MDKYRAYKFIILMGFVSLLSDFTYEGAKGIIGPYLAHLGASAFVVGLISGFSELAGYWVRLFSGFLSDRIKNPWGFTLFGYTLNLFSVPLLGFAKNWQMAGFLFFLERFGKGIRTPSRDALLSVATARIGHGKGFGIHEFLDQIGAVLGPLVVSYVLFLGFGYRWAFLFLFIPALFALCLLLFAKRSYKDKIEYEKAKDSSLILPKTFYVYLFASSLVALSFLPFPLIGFHLSQEAFEGWKISLLFALAMGADALSALLFGLLYDRIGFYSLALGLSFGVLALLFLLNNPVIAIVFWGISLGVQESIMRSAVAHLSPQTSRGKAYGIFHFFFGLSTFLGSTLMGYLYQISTDLLILYSIGLHLLAIGILIRLKP